MTRYYSNPNCITYALWFFKHTTKYIQPFVKDTKHRRDRKEEVLKFDITNVSECTIKHGA